MRLERVNISERGIAHTGHRTSVMQEFADIRAAAAHAFEPRPGHQSQRIVEAGEPRLDLVIAPDRAGESKQIIHLHHALSSRCLLYTSPSPRDRQKSRM